MALVLTRKVNEIVWANDVQVVVMHHEMVEGVKQVTLKAIYPDDTEVEGTIPKSQDVKFVLSRAGDPDMSVTLSDASKQGVRLAFHGDRDTVLFLRDELKGTK